MSGGKEVEEDQAGGDNRMFILHSVFPPSLSINYWLANVSFIKRVAATWQAIRNCTSESYSFY